MYNMRPLFKDSKYWSKLDQFITSVKCMKTYFTSKLYRQKNTLIIFSQVFFINVYFPKRSNCCICFPKFVFPHITPAACLSY